VRVEKKGSELFTGEAQRRRKHPTFFDSGILDGDRGKQGTGPENSGRCGPKSEASKYKKRKGKNELPREGFLKRGDRFFLRRETVLGVQGEAVFVETTEITSTLGDEVTNR